MAAGGQVNLTVSDGGSATVNIPGSSVQLVIGCSSLGTVGQIVATRSPTTLLNNLGVGPLPEAAGLAAGAGGLVIAIKAASSTSGAFLLLATSSVSGATNVSPIAITTTAPHGLATGQVVAVSGVGGNTGANGTFVITVVDTTHFTLNGSSGTGAYTSGGTVTPGAITTTMLPGVSGSIGTSVPTTSGTPADTYYFVLKIVNGGTVGTSGITYQMSLDAGRNFGPVLSLGTSTSIGPVGSTGITISLASGTLTTGQQFQFSTTEPTWNTAGLQAALNTFQGSAYAIVGVGSTHIVGSQNYAASGSTAGTLEGYLDTLAAARIYTRAFFSARDASPAAAWGGTGETESTWMTSLQTDYSAQSDKRLCVGAAYWNMPSIFPNPATTGASSYRRPVTYAAAARQVTVPPQRHIGRVKDGALSQIVVNPTSDPYDGFVYHDERINSGLDYIIAGSGGRFMSTMTRIGNPGIFISDPLLMSPLGSDFWLMPLGNVMDIFADIIQQVGQTIVDDDLRINANGTLYENDARAIENALCAAVNDQMFSAKMISQPVQPGKAPGITVDRTVNVQTTSTVVLTGTITPRGYAITVNATLGFQNPNAAT